MIYALLTALVSLVGSVVASVYYKGRWKSEKARREQVEKERQGSIDALADRIAQQTEAAKRYEAIIRGHKLEILRLEKDIENALSNDPAAVREYVNSRLSASPPQDATAPAEYVQDPDTTEGRKR